MAAPPPHSTSEPDMHIRRYTEGDLASLAAVYRASVEHGGRGHYTPEQIRIWASFADDLEHFEDVVNKGVTLLALSDDEQLAGFAQLHPVHHLSLLFVAPAFMRQGVATLLYQALEARARVAGEEVLTTDASLVARPFFARMGFVVVERETVVRSGLELDRFRMKKVLEVEAGVATKQALTNE